MQSELDKLYGEETRGLFRWLGTQAGYATRCYPLTENLPKSLSSMKKKPILDWLIEISSRVGKQYDIGNQESYPTMQKVYKTEQKIII